MALNMRIQTASFGDFTTLDLEAERIHSLKLSQGYSHPAKLTWEMDREQHSFPLDFNVFVQFWDDGGSSPDGQSGTGSAFSASNPNFEGFIEEIEPAASNRIRYTAYDPTSKAGKEVPCMSQAWTAGNAPNIPPQEGNGAVPRIVYNSMIDNDDDHQHSRGHNVSLGTILENLLDDAYHPLYWLNAAPGDGTSAGNGTAYESSDTALLTFQPQEKLVYESEAIRSAVDRTLQYEPRARLMWIPGTRKWRIRDITQAPAQTLTLNSFDGDRDVLTLDLDRSMENRATAVRFYGPESHVAAIASQVDGGLAPFDPSDYVVLERLGSVEIRSFDKFQITDTSKQNMAPTLPAWITVYMGGYHWQSFRTETVQASWDGGNTWRSIKGAWFDRRQGIIYLGGHVFIYNSEGQVVQTGTQHYFPPDYFRVIYAYIGTPITVRRPADGSFEGTAYTVGRLALEQKFYDESLAVGYELGTPVTTATRLAQFGVLAQAILNERKDIIYAGGLTIDGIDYSFDRLYHRVNLAGVDEDGSAVTTGWEAINANVTDVEYDYDQRLTTIQFSSDQQELIGWDPDALKEMLKIRALERRQFGVFAVKVTKRRAFTEFGTPIIGADIEQSFQSIRGFENPFNAGAIDQAISPNDIGDGGALAGGPVGEESL